MTVGWKLRILGYRSIGLSVPEVMMTLWNLVNTGFMARLASKQLNCARQQMVQRRFADFLDLLLQLSVAWGSLFSPKASPSV